MTFREIAREIYENARIIKDPEMIESLAKKNAKITGFGSLSYVGKVRSRSARFTKNTVDDVFDESDFETLEKVKEDLNKKELICIERTMGKDPRGKLSCRLLITKPHARVGHGWGKLLSNGKKKNPDLITVAVPEWEKVKVLVSPIDGVTFILGSDYIGEVKKSFLRMWMWKIKERGGLGMHAGSKVVRVNNGNGLEEITQLFLGLSATGKTTITCHGMGLNGEEYAKLCQDDVGGFFEDGSFIGTENKGMFIKTEGLNPEEQPELYKTVTDSTAILENVWVDGNEKVDFYDYRLTGNGRAVVLRSKMTNITKKIDVERVDQIFLLTRNPIAPPVARLSKELATAFFMLGESVESSAGDPSKAGQYIRIVGTNPFIVGSRGEEGNRFFEILKKNPSIECYVLNTGEVGNGSWNVKITLEDTLKILKSLIKGNTEWKKDPDWGYEIPVAVDGIDNKKLDPSKLFDEKEYERLVDELRTQRIEWLSQFNGLRPEIANVFNDGTSLD